MANVDQDKSNIEALDEVDLIEPKRYHVSGTMSKYSSGSYNTVEEALEKASELVREGYTSVNVRDTEGDGDIW